MNSRSLSHSSFRCQRGASLVEFSIIGLSVILVGLFTLQLGLIYHAKTTLNYAVFEAARAGAVNNASMSAIRTELGIRLAPLQGGDGTRNKALAAIAKSSLKVLDPLNTSIVILNPTRAAFRDWAILDPDSGQRFIPVNHLRHQSYEVGSHSGLSLRDANLLKLHVTHGVDLRVPVVGKLMATAMQWIDLKNAVFYAREKWPLQSVATVRMQSDVFEAEILKSASSGGTAGGGPDGGGTGASTGGDGTGSGGGFEGGLAGGGSGSGESSGDVAGEGQDDGPGVDSGDNVGDSKEEPQGSNVGEADQSIDDIATGPVLENGSASEGLPPCADGYSRVRNSSHQPDASQVPQSIMSTDQFRLLLADI